MIIDLNRYRKTIKPLVQYYVERNPDKDVGLALGEIANITTCHIIAVGYYMAELFGMTDELRAKIDRLEKYYDNPTVTNKESVK